ncbi:MAG: signal peptidase II [Bacilli bacterium]|jgi:signal peptidase II
MKEKFKKFFYSFYWLIFVLVLLDQVLKILAMTYKWDVVVIPGVLEFKYIRNTGGAFSMMDGNIVSLMLVSLFATIAMLFYRIYNRNKLNTAHKVVWAVVIGGTIGNLIDRAFYRLITGTAGVVDFIYVPFFANFNFADMCLTLGLIALIVLVFVDDNKSKKPKVIEAEYTETVISKNGEKVDGNSDNQSVNEK